MLRRVKLPAWKDNEANAWSITPLSEQVQELWVVCGVNTEWKRVSGGKMYPIYPCTSGPFLPKNWSKKKIALDLWVGSKTEIKKHSEQIFRVTVAHLKEISKIKGKFFEKILTLKSEKHFLALIHGINLICTGKYGKCENFVKLLVEQKDWRAGCKNL